MNETVVNSVSTKYPSDDSTIAPVAIFFHSDCMGHSVGHHPECPERVDSILTALHSQFPNSAFHEAPMISDKNILLFHSKEHLFGLKKLFDKAEYQKSLLHIDGDTAVMWATRKAAYRAAGSVVAAVDQVLSTPKKARSVFCCVRPPGHHAEPSRACGFCYFNNAAIGARYAQQKYGVERVAVLDFDVHHGNGTEEGFLHDPSLFYGSTHEKGNFPGTGFDPTPRIGELAAKDVDRRIVDRFLINDRCSDISVRDQFRLKWEQIVDEMIRFRPNLVIFSAGFDAHADDPLASCDLIEEDYYWATEIVIQACKRINPESPPPCISVLEGGYDLDAIARSALVHVTALSETADIQERYDLNSLDALDESSQEADNVQEQSKDNSNPEVQELPVQDVNSEPETVETGPDLACGSLDPVDEATEKLLELGF